MRFPLAVVIGALFAALLHSASSRAATLNLTPQVTAYWANDVDIGTTSQPVPYFNPTAGNYRIDIWMSCTLSPADMAAGFTGFGNVAFDISYGPRFFGSQPFIDNFGGWAPIIPSVRTAGDGARYTDPINNGIKTAGANLNTGRANLWTDNADIGVSTTDLKFIYVDVGQLAAFGANDPRNNATTPNQNSFLTQVAGNPLLLGSIVLRYNGFNPGVVSISFGTGEGYSLHNNATMLHGPVTTVGASGGSVVFGLDGPPPPPANPPEPASLSVVMFGLAGTVFRARRQRS